ncbi:hypothetical protein M7775_02010 [Sporomusa sphaeroides DSM 2875]|uniref:hypothetical protein n=1 Tax=Sporomusa sphaeroides TaxID=47679 RepID=UPI002030344E|nr:hypothetical protein [Sporomusa sphaeroides]MCM0757342.1 hypothetical protein [Sporomusa sphaeroides DSM 2875]
MYEYIAPYVSVQIGPWATTKTVSVEVHSSRINPIDTANIVIPTEGIGTADITKGMPVEIHMGYREKGLWPVLSGKVMDVSTSRVIQVQAKDSMETLRQTRITKAFVDAVPREIIKYALLTAGIESHILNDKILPRRHHYVSKALTVIQLINHINRTWALEDYAYYFEPDGQFYWGPWEESPRYNGGQPVGTLEYGVSILDLVPSDESTGTLKTFLLPWINHSELLILRDTRFWSAEVLVRIERVQYSLGAAGTEMNLEWKILKS